MTKKEKVAYILRELELLYPDPPVPLDHRDSFTLLIAVLLSAQCTDARVNLVTPKLFELADNPYQMVKLSVSLIESIIRPCGLSPAKSKNIHRLSELLIERHGGEVPSSLEEMEALPGVGHKTAGVVMIQAFGVPAFPVDTHIHRMLYRWGLSNGKSVQQTERDAKRLFPEETWIKLHLQIIFYAREYSPARGFSEDRDYVTMKVAGKVKSLPA
jgi:endonuclease-3